MSSTPFKVPRMIYGALVVGTVLVVVGGGVVDGVGWAVVTVVDGGILVAGVAEVVMDCA
jgi:hypothetical protein